MIYLQVSLEWAEWPANLFCVSKITLQKYIAANIFLFQKFICIVYMKMASLQFSTIDLSNFHVGREFCFVCCYAEESLFAFTNVYLFCG